MENKNPCPVVNYFSTSNYYSHSVFYEFVPTPQLQCVLRACVFHFFFSQNESMNNLSQFAFDNDVYYIFL